MNYYVSVWRKEDGEERLLKEFTPPVSLLGGAVKARVERRQLVLETGNDTVRLPADWDRGIWPPVPAGRGMAAGLRPLTRDPERVLDISGCVDVRIGRDPFSAICIDEKLVSRRHLLIWRLPGMPRTQKWAMRVTSPNGAYVNGRKYEKDSTLYLSDGDRITIPGLTFQCWRSTLEVPAGQKAEYRLPDYQIPEAPEERYRRIMAMKAKEEQAEQVPSGGEP